MLVVVLPPQMQELLSVAMRLERGGCAQSSEAPYRTKITDCI